MYIPAECLLVHGNFLVSNDYSWGWNFFLIVELDNITDDYFGLGHFKEIAVSKDSIFFVFIFFKRLFRFLFLIQVNSYDSDHQDTKKHGYHVDCIHINLFIFQYGSENDLNDRNAENHNVMQFYDA